MEFSGLFLLPLLAIGLLALAGTVGHMFFTRSPHRKIALWSFFLGVVFLVVLARSMHKVYGVDEELVFAAREGNLGRVRSLLAADANPNATFEGTSALKAARESGKPEIVKALVEAGARD